jgi:hypothetical protein
MNGFIKTKAKNRYIVGLKSNSLGVDDESEKLLDVAVAVREVNECP